MSVVPTSCKVIQQNFLYHNCRNYKYLVFIYVILTFQTKLHIDIENAVAKGEFDKAEQLSDDLATREVSF